jgi:prepilin-type N-terminal cleavage/methylation domain-containing protein
VLIRGVGSRLTAAGGFTLVEMVCAMAILTITVAAFAQLFAFTIKRSTQTEEQATVQTEARAGIDTFTSDLRQALCKDTTTTPVTTATANQITFYSPDRLTPYHLRQVSYRLSGTNFQRQFVTSTNTGGPTWTMPSLGASWINVFGQASQLTTPSTPIFQYFDSNGAATTTASAVAQVIVTVVVTPRGSSGGDGKTAYSATVDLRTPTCD